MGPIWPAIYVMYTLQAKNDFYIFKWLGEKKNMKLHEIQISVSISQVFLKHQHAYSLAYCRWQLSFYNSRVKQVVKRMYGTYDYNTYYWVFKKKLWSLLSILEFASESDPMECWN